MKVGLQMYSIQDVRDSEGLLSALRLAKELGYEGVEFAGTAGLVGEEDAVLREMQTLGLECAGFHISANEVAADVEGWVKTAKRFGAYSFCIPMQFFRSAEQWIAFARELNETGKHFRAEGIRFGYHNHMPEFEVKDGIHLMDALLENTEAENVYFELDPRHAYLAGTVPHIYAKRYADRISFIHARDTNEIEDVAVGSGKVDFEAIVQAVGMPDWFIVENGSHGKNRELLRESAEYLKRTFR